jgi:hypothetical protein
LLFAEVRFIAAFARAKSTAAFPRFHGISQRCRRMLDKTPTRTIFDL